jgi:hypothetical protein
VRESEHERELDLLHALRWNLLDALRWNLLDPNTEAQRLLQAVEHLIAEREPHPDWQHRRSG